MPDAVLDLGHLAAGGGCTAIGGIPLIAQGLDPVVPLGDALGQPVALFAKPVGLSIPRSAEGDRSGNGMRCSDLSGILP
jgi:hypothetical protein